MKENEGRKKKEYFGLADIRTHILYENFEDYTTINY